MAPLPSTRRPLIIGSIAFTVISVLAAPVVVAATGQSTTVLRYVLVVAAVGLLTLYPAGAVRLFSAAATIGLVAPAIRSSLALFYMPAMLGLFMTVVLHISRLASLAYIAGGLGCGLVIGILERALSSPIA